MTTDYEARRISREYYVTWLENAERSSRNRPTPLCGDRPKRETSVRSIRTKILAQL